VLVPLDLALRSVRIATLAVPIYMERFLALAKAIRPVNASVNVPAA
jgi:hypothetical protein